MTDRVRQVIKRNHFAAGEDRRAFQSIVQLADIAGPSITRPAPRLHLATGGARDDREPIDILFNIQSAKGRISCVRSRSGGSVNVITFRR